MSRILGIDRSQHDFRFTRRWFEQRNLLTFREYILPEWAGKPCTYLEIGVFEGMSLVWMLQHVLTHKDSFAIGVDPWLMTAKLDGDAMHEKMENAVHNLRPWLNSEKCRIVRANSAELLRAICKRGGWNGIKPGDIDLCMIDGGHHALAALDDAEMVLKVLRPGGWMIFDDVENRVEKSDHVKDGLSMFLDQHGDEVEFLWKHRYMEAYRKRAGSG